MREAQSAPVEIVSIRRADHRAPYRAERIGMTARWKDRCGELRQAGLVIPLRGTSLHCNGECALSER
jgi:hypothetical protein